MTAHSESLAESFGYMTVEEVKALKRICANIVTSPYPTFVNVGAGAGTSSLAMAEANPSAKIVSVDVSPGGPLGGFEGETNAFASAGRPRPIQIQGKSHYVAENWPKSQPIDLIFIDDGHLEDEIRGDITLWLPHVKDDGVIVFHDYGEERWPDVKKVVDELMLGKYQVITIVDKLIAFRKNN